MQVSAYKIILTLCIFFFQDIVVQLADILCSAIDSEAQELEEEVLCNSPPPGGPTEDESNQSKELDNLLQTLDWLLQLSGNDSSSCCERLRNCMVVERGTQIMLNQSVEEETEKKVGDTTLESVISSEHQNADKDDDLKKDDVKSMSVCQQSVSECSGQTVKDNTTPDYNTGALSECKTKQNNNNVNAVTYNDHARPET